MFDPTWDTHLFVLLYSSDCSLTSVSFLRGCKHFRLLASLTSFLLSSHYHFSYLCIQVTCLFDGFSFRWTLDSRSGWNRSYLTLLAGNFLLMISSWRGGIGNYHLITWWCPPHVYLLTRAPKDQAGQVPLGRLCGVPSSIVPAENSSGVGASPEKRGKYGLCLCWVGSSNVDMNCLL